MGRASWNLRTQRHGSRDPWGLVLLVRWHPTTYMGEKPSRATLAHDQYNESGIYAVVTPIFHTVKTIWWMAAETETSRFSTRRVTKNESLRIMNRSAASRGPRIHTHCAACGLCTYCRLVIPNPKLYALGMREPRISGEHAFSPYSREGRLL
jgi:hypothetical protein